MKNYVEQKVNVAQLVLDVLCFLLAILAAVIYAAVGEWRNIHSAIFVGVFAFFIIRLVIFSLAEQFRTRRETALVNVPFVLVLLAIVFDMHLSFAWPFFLFVSVWFLLLIVYDIYDIKKPDKRMEHLRQKFEESQVPPPRAVSPPMRDLGAGSTPVINPSLDIPPWTRQSDEPPFNEEDTEPIMPTQVTGRGAGQSGDKPASPETAPSASVLVKQRDANWFYGVLIKMKTTIFQRGKQYADERAELREHFKRTTLDREVLERHNVREDLVNGVDNGDFQELLRLLRSPSQVSDKLLRDLAEALAEGCKPRAQKVRYRRPRNNS